MSLWVCGVHVDVWKNVVARHLPDFTLFVLRMVCRAFWKAFPDVSSKRYRSAYTEALILGYPAHFLHQLHSYRTPLHAERESYTRMTIINGETFVNALLARGDEELYHWCIRTFGKQLLLQQRTYQFLYDAARSGSIEFLQFFMKAIGCGGVHEKGVALVVFCGARRSSVDSTAILNMLTSEQLVEIARTMEAYDELGLRHFQEAYFGSNWFVFDWMMRKFFPYTELAWAARGRYPLETLVDGSFLSASIFDKDHWELWKHVLSRHDIHSQFIDSVSRDRLLHTMLKKDALYCLIIHLQYLHAPNRLLRKTLRHPATLTHGDHAALAGYIVEYVTYGDLLDLLVRGTPPSGYLSWGVVLKNGWRTLPWLVKFLGPECVPIEDIDDFILKKDEDELFDDDERFIRLANAGLKCSERCLRKIVKKNPPTYEDATHPDCDITAHLDYLVEHKQIDELKLEALVLEIHSKRLEKYRLRAAEEAKKKLQEPPKPRSINEREPGDSDDENTDAPSDATDHSAPYDSKNASPLDSGAEDSDEDGVYYDESEIE